MTARRAASPPRGKSLRMPVLTGLLLASAALAIIAGLTVGDRTLPPGTVIDALLSRAGRVDTIIVWTLRLPRSIAAFTAGAGLALAGFLLQ